jgi:hypothetical protein
MHIYLCFKAILMNVNDKFNYLLNNGFNLIKDFNILNKIIILLMKNNLKN